MKYILILIGMVMAVLPSKGQDTMAKPEGAVVDQANLLTADQIKTIQQSLFNLFTARETKGYLLIVDSVPTGQNIYSFTKGIFKKWGLNTENDGMNFIMVYSKRDHGVRIEASDKIITILSKDYIKEVIETSVKPYLKKRQDYEGLRRGLEMITKKIENN